MISLPNTQVLNSSTFRTPPLQEQELTLPELYDWHLYHSPSHPLFIFSDGAGKIRTIPWEEAVRAIHRAAHFVSSRVEHNDASFESRPIVAVLAATGLFAEFSSPGLISQSLQIQ